MNPKLRLLVTLLVGGGLILGLWFFAQTISSLTGYSIGADRFDDFAKCLTEKGAVMYGAMDWCKFTQAQKAMFGKSFRHIDYREFNEIEGIKITPTWVINGKWHENTQSLDKLSALSGCKI